MPFLLHIAFSNTHRLPRRFYLFEYAGVQFKLVQNDPRRWADALLTLTPVHDDTAQQAAYSAAAEFLSALSWEVGSSIALQGSGGVGVRPEVELSDALCRVFVFPKVPMIGRIRGSHPSRLPMVETDEQRTALALLREACSSNKLWLSFLLCWQVLEVGGHVRPTEWIDHVRGVRRDQVHVPIDELRGIDLAGKTLGEYLPEDCRHAIAHLRRDPGRRAIQIDDIADNRRLAISSRVMNRFANHYIREVLGLRSSVHLVRVGGRGMPGYKPEEFLHSHACTLAYTIARRRLSLRDQQRRS